MGCCCIKENEKSKHQDSDEKYEQETTDFRIKKGMTQINILFNPILESNSKVIVSTCDSRGYSGQNQILEKKQALGLQLANAKLKIGSIIKIQNDKTYIFLILPIYLGEDKQINQLKQCVQDLVDLIIEDQVESIAIEDVGVKRFGFPRQVVSKIIIEAFAFSLHRMTSLKQLDFMLDNIHSKALFEQEVQARRDKLVKTSNINSDSTDVKQMSIPLLEN